MADKNIPLIKYQDVINALETYIKNNATNIKGTITNGNYDAYFKDKWKWPKIEFPGIIGGKYAYYTYKLDSNDISNDIRNIRTITGMQKELNITNASDYITEGNYLLLMENIAKYCSQRLFLYTSYFGIDAYQSCLVYDNRKTITGMNILDKPDDTPINASEVANLLNSIEDKARSMTRTISCQYTVELSNS